MKVDPFQERVHRLAKRYRETIPRLVEGVIKSPSSTVGHWIQVLIDPNNQIPVSYAHLVVERVQKLYKLPFGPKCTPRYEVERVLFEDVSRAVTLVFGLKRVLDLTSTPFGEKELLLLFRKSVSLSWGGVLEKWWKHQVSWIFARWMRDEVPATPQWWVPAEKEGFLLGGQFRRYQTLYLHGGSERVEPLALSLLHIKRVAERVACDFIRETLEKHRKALTCLRQRPAKVVRTSEIYDSIRITIDECVPRKKNQELRIRVPSLRSHYESSRKERGAVGFLVQKYRIPPCRTLLSMDAVVGVCQSPTPWKEWTRPKGVEREAHICMDDYLDFDPRRVTPLGEARTYACTRMIETYGLFDPEDIFDAYRKCLEEGFNAELLNTVPVALCEPFKVRVITKGPVEAYWVAKSVQGIVHGYMRRHPTFQLIGHPCSQDVVDEFLWKCSDSDYLISGDYDAATDNLDPDLTDFAFCYLVQRLGLWPTPALRAALVGHLVHYESGSYPQEWGQLMGSPLSFPILCILNAALSRLALDRELRRPLRELPMLINGDDILMGMSLPQYEVWKGITRQGGLSYSVGKNYCSRKYVMINSECYRVKRSRLIGPLEEGLTSPPEIRTAEYRPFINLGLMKGQGRQMDSVHLFGKGEYVSDLAGLACALVKGHTPEMANKLLSLFIQDNRDELDSLPAGMSWFLPRCSGGYGLPLVRAVQFSSEQLKVAAYIRTGQGNLQMKYLETDAQLSHLLKLEDQQMLDRGIEWVEGGEGQAPSLMTVNWPALNRERTPDETMKSVRTNFARLRERALRTSLNPMESLNALKSTTFGWARSVTLKIPAQKTRII